MIKPSAPARQAPQTTEGAMDYSDNWAVAMEAVFLLALAVVLTGIAAELSGRKVRHLPVPALAALPLAMLPRRRNLVAAVYLITGLGPQLRLAVIVVAQPFGLRDNGRAVIAVELVLVALWVVRLALLPPDAGARWPDWRLPPDAAVRHAADRGPHGRAREFEARVAWWAWAGVGLTLLAVLAWAWPQLSGEPDFAFRVGVPLLAMGATFVYKGARGRGAKRTRPRRG